MKSTDPNAVSAYIEVEDSTYTSGKVGIWHESNSNGFIDNVYIFDERALPVLPLDKLAVTWGRLKASM